MGASNKRFYNLLDDVFPAHDDRWQHQSAQFSDFLAEGPKTKAEVVDFIVVLVDQLSDDEKSELRPNWKASLT